MRVVALILLNRRLATGMVVCDYCVAFGCSDFPERAAPTLFALVACRKGEASGLRLIMQHATYYFDMKNPLIQNV